MTLKPLISVIGLVSCFVFAPMLSGCVHKTEEVLLAEASDIQKTNPDSANMILDKINPEKLPEHQRIVYDEIKISYMIHVSMQWESADSLNNRVLAYGMRENEPTRLKKALFVSGYINLHKNNPDKAIEQFLKLKDIAEETSDTDLFNCYFFLSHVYFDKKEYENALLYAKKISPFYENSDTIRKMSYFRYVASIYKQMNTVDSALYYYNIILNNHSDNEHYQRIVKQARNDLIELYVNHKDYKEALRYADLNIQHRTSRTDISFFNLTKARVFLATNRTDSAKFYLHRAINSSENEFVAIASYQYLSDLYKMTGDFEQSYFSKLNYKDVFENRMMDINQHLLMYKYQQEKLKNENNELKLTKREQEIVFLSIASISLLIIVILLFYLFEYRKKRNLQEYKMKEERLKTQTLLVENENKLLRQENELTMLREKSAILRESLFRKMSVATKIPSLKTLENETAEGFTGNRIHLEETDWNELFQTTNELFYGFVSRLEKEYPDLSKEDIGFCCLVKINVSMNDLADIYCISKAGVTKKKTRMKKEKFGITDKATSLETFLFSF